MTDFLLKTFFEKPRWEQAIQTGVEKQIDPVLLKNLCKAETRLKLYRNICSGKYVIQPPHEARIPKDDGSARTVYVNDGQDRIVLSVINDMMFELCPEMIHKNCLSYQKGIGCGKIAKQVSRIVSCSENNEIGVKIDLSKYFDSVPIKFIDEAFDKIEAKNGRSKILDILRRYYHDDSVYTIDRKLIKKYSSLRQGCAVAAFLADVVLYNVDSAISSVPNINYFRYSDDILIIGDNWQTAYEVLKKELDAMNLTLNPKKIETICHGKWFKFLGFNIKDKQISLSKNRLKTFQSEIKTRTIDSPSKNIYTAISKINRYLYKGNVKDYSWATNILPVINVKSDINILNGFIMDAVRASVTGKTRIGGLGIDTSKADGCIQRGKGKHVKSNKESVPFLNGYMTLACMQNAINTSRGAYETLVRVM